MTIIYHIYWISVYLELKIDDAIFQRIHEIFEWKDDRKDKTKIIHYEILDNYEVSYAKSVFYFTMFTQLFPVLFTSLQNNF